MFGVYYHKIDLVKEVEEHGGVSVCVRRVVLEAWYLTHPGVEIPHGQQEEALGFQLGCLLSDEEEQIFIPLEIVLISRCLASYVDVEEGTLLLVAVHQQPLPLVLDVLKVGWDRGRPLVSPEAVLVVHGEASPTLVIAGSLCVPSEVSTFSGQPGRLVRPSKGFTQRKYLGNNIILWVNKLYREILHHSHVCRSVDQ